MNNHKIIIITISLIIIGVVSGTVLKVSKEHSRKTIEVIEKRIIESSLSCQWDDMCNNEVSLGFLIEKGYSKEEVNPITKMYYSHDSMIKCQDQTCQFIAK